MDVFKCFKDGFNNNQFIDIHTHKRQNGDNFSISNVFVQDLVSDNVLPDYPVSVGLHPWHIQVVDYEKCIQYLDEVAGNTNIYAIGEIGLDRAIETPLSLQMEVFKKQIEISERVGKPAIIHGVKAYSDLLALRKQLKSKQPWIIHGFNGNFQIATQFINSGCYLSFGKELMKHNHKTIETFFKLADHYFFETDEENYSIADIYSFAAHQKNISVDELKSIVISNYCKCFRTQEKLLSL